MRAEARSPGEGPLAELEDGAAALRAYARRQGREFDLVESSATSCTVRAARDALDYWPVEVTVSVADVERAGLAQHPDWLADPQTFLAVWATREAAGIVLPAVVLEFEEERLLARLCLKQSRLTATAAEWGLRLRSLRAALKAWPWHAAWRARVRRRRVRAPVIR